MHRPLRLALALPLLAAACGDNDEAIPVDDDPGPAPDAAPGDPRPGRAVIVSGDFGGTGVLSTVAAPSLEVQVNAVAGVASGDPVVRRIGDELFVINRFGGDNITILDAATLTLIDQFSTGADSNPQDVAVVGDKLYVAALGAGGVLVFDRSDTSTFTTIDLSNLDDDGVPDCVSIYPAGEHLYVACGLLDFFSAVENGKIVKIDPSEGTVEGTVTMPERNPVGWFTETPLESAFGGDLLISTSSFIDSSLGCLVRLKTGPAWEATCGPANTAMEGGVSRLAVHDGGLWASVVAYSNYATLAARLVRLDLATGDIDEPASSSEQQILDVASCGDYVFVADKAMDAQGIRVFGADGVELTTAPLDIGLPPSFGNAIACAQ